MSFTLYFSLPLSVSVSLSLCLRLSLSLCLWPPVVGGSAGESSQWRDTRAGETSVQASRPGEFGQVQIQRKIKYIRFQNALIYNYIIQMLSGEELSI